jgi:long-chain fatty acid transport protein
VAGPAVGAAAQPADTFGFGARSTALGGAVTSDVTDVSSNYYNPAGLVREDALRLAVGYLTSKPELEINGHDSQLDPVRGIVFGVAVPAAIDDLHLALGLAVYLPDDRVSRARALPRQRPRWELFDNRPHRALITGNLAVRVTEWLRVGGGVSFQSTTNNDLKVRGDLSVFQPETQSALEHQFEAELETIRAPQAGLQIDPLPGLSIGATYRGEFQLETSLDAEAMIDIVVGDAFPGLLVLETASVNAFLPQQIAFGVAYAPFPWLRAGVDLTWVDWSAYVSAIGSTDALLEIDVPEGLENVIDVPDEIPSTRPIPAEFSDRFVPRMGVELTPVTTDAYELPVRLGYVYERSPAPEQRGFTNLVDADRHVLSLGAGVLLRALEPLITGDLALDAMFSFSHFSERVHEKDSLVDPVGDYRAGGYLLSGALTAEVRFR